MKKIKIYWLLVLLCLPLSGTYKRGCSCENFLTPEYDFRFQVSNRSDDPIEPYLFDESLGYFPVGHLAMRSKKFSSADYPTVAEYYVEVIFSARNLTTGKLSKPQKVKLHIKSTPLIEFTNNSFRYLKMTANGKWELVAEYKLDYE